MSPKDDRIHDLEIDVKDLQSMLDASKDRCDRLEMAQLKVLEAHPPRFIIGRDGLTELRCEVCRTPEHHTWGNDNLQPWPCPTVAATGLRWACYHQEDEVLRMAADIRADQAEKVMGPVDMCPPEEDTHDPDDDLPTVCVTHLRHVPCRGTSWREDDCQLSSHPDAVTAVRRYQTDEHL